MRKRAKADRNARTRAEMRERRPKRANPRLAETREGWRKRAKAGGNARRLAETRGGWPKRAEAGRNAQTLAETRGRWPKHADAC
nr:hypothetical protein [Tanacetum cinerariifolium]